MSAQHTYPLGHDTQTVACLEVRESEHEAAFLLPHLKPGQRLLDCGCGPGTISVGLAKAVAPGEMVGLDAEVTQVQAAVARATELGIANAVFEVGDLTDLRFDDETFDVVFAHAVVMHLPKPAAGLAEMRRVTKPEGIVAIRDPISDASICVQENPLFHEGFKLFARAVAEAGGDVSRGRDLGPLLSQAGFARVELSVSFEQPRSPDDRPRVYGAWAGLWDGTAIAEKVVTEGWTQPGVPEQIAAAWREFGASDTGLVAMPWCEAIARKS